MLGENQAMRKFHKTKFVLSKTVALNKSILQVWDILWYCFQKWHMAADGYEVTEKWVSVT